MYEASELGLAAYRRLGNGRLLALCPFHSDHKPSMSVDLRKGVFNCFTCGSSGSLAKLVLETGGALVENYEEVDEVVHEERREAVLELYLGATIAIGNSYLLKRGVTNAQIERHHVIDLGKSIGLPLFDGTTLCGIQLRRTTGLGTWRYLFVGDRPTLWYNAYAETRAETLVVEGIFGALAAERAGYGAVTTLSASAANEIPLVRSKAVVLFDDDKAGYIGAMRVLLSTADSEAIVPGAAVDDLSATELMAKVEEGQRVSYATELLPFIDEAARAEVEESMGKRSRRALGLRVPKIWS